MLMNELDPMPRLFERLTSDHGTELLIALRLARGRSLTPRDRRLLLLVEKLAASVQEAGGVEVTTAVARSSDGLLRICRDSRVVSLGGREIAFARRELDLLLFLAEHPRHVFSRPQLLQHVWGYAEYETRTVDVHIRRLRQKLDLHGSFINTVRGVGYSLDSSAGIVIV